MSETEKLKAWVEELKWVHDRVDRPAEGWKRLEAVIADIEAKLKGQEQNESR